MGLRLSDGGLVCPQGAGGDHNGAALSQERTGAGFRGRPPSARCPGSGAECGGFEGGRSIGRSIPSPQPSV